jgi:hypothetical protein
MGIEINFPFDTPSSYTYDSSKVQITGGKASLKLIDNPGQHFTEVFDSPTGFTYDPTKSEFIAGKLQQKDQRPVNATFYAAYTSNINGTWGNGVLTGTATGGASVSGGKLDLRGATKYVSYNAVNNANSYQVGCIRFKYTPNYSGLPAASRTLFSITKESGSLLNLISIYHASSGNLYLIMNNYLGVVIIDEGSPLGAWSPTAGVEYEFELNWDLTTGATRLFINGIQFGSTKTQTGTRSGTIGLFLIGSKYILGQLLADGYFDDILVFSTVQHTSNYTPSWTTIYETLYVDTYADFPAWTYEGAGEIQAILSAVAISQGNERWVLEGYYWTGTEWSISNKTFAQASTSTDIADHALELIMLIGFNPNPINTIVFPSGNTKGWIDNFDVEYIGQIYPTDNPTIEINSRWYLDELELIQETSTKTGSDQIKAILKKDTLWYYWNGSAWTTSDGTYSQSNTIAEIETNKTSFVDSRTYFGVKLFLYSETGLTTPELDTLLIQYSYAGEIPDTINKCLVWGLEINSRGNPIESEIQITLIDKVIKYKTITTIEKDIAIVTADATGYWEIELIENENMDGNQCYRFLINGKNYYKIVSDIAESNIWELEDWEDS